MKGHITMSKKEVNRIPIIQRALKGELTCDEGGKIIGVSKRQFRRIKNNYKKYGVEGIVHKSRGRRSNSAISEEIKDYAMRLVQEKYHDFKPTLAHEKLSEIHGITMSVETLRQEMIKTGIWKPKLRKRINIHQPRERRSQEGELVQVDGSPHDWFEGRQDECTLLVYIDDATGKLMWLEFVEAETTEDYFRATESYLKLHGRPLAFYTDKHSVFKVNMEREDGEVVRNSGRKTQFARAMEELDIEIIAANSPQAKGRVERANQTLQDRLVKEMRLKRISAIEDANKYLPRFMEIFNQKFAVKPKSNINAHRPLLQCHNLSEILCKKDTRIISKALTVRYENKVYKILLEPGTEYILRKAKVDITEKKDGEVIIRYKDKQLDYEIMETVVKQEVHTAKTVRKHVEKLKVKQGRSFQFNFLGTVNFFV
jgi:hypothetical protein